MLQNSGNIGQCPEPDVKAALLYFIFFRKSFASHVVWQMETLFYVLHSCTVFKQQGSLDVRMVDKHKSSALRALALFQPSVLE